jgi:hypothetical protein
MSKIVTEVRYKDTSFNLIKEVNGLRMYMNGSESDFCIIVDTEDNVLFELRAGCSQNYGYLEDVSELL